MITLKYILEHTYKDLRTGAKDSFLNIRKKSNTNTTGTHYVKITKRGVIKFKTPSFTEGSDEYIQYIKLLDFDKYINKFKSTLPSHDIVKKIIEGDIKIHCTDPSWKFWGFQYKGTVNNYAIKPETRAPVIRNPKVRGAVCKHLDNALYILPFLTRRITRDLINLGILNK